MASIKASIPNQVQLDLSLFPKNDLGTPEAWASSIVSALNKFTAQTVTYLQVQASPKGTRTLQFSTGSTVAASFPITLTLTTLPTEIRVAQVVRGTQDIATPITIQWQFVNNASNNATRQVQITGITGLAASTQYEILLVLE